MPTCPSPARSAHTQRDALGHGSAGHESGGLEAESPADLGLEVLDHRPMPIVVEGDLSFLAPVGDAPQLIRWRQATVAHQAPGRLP